MLTFKGHNVWITMGDAGTHATEFSIETDSDEKTVTCWIASEVGKTFAVNWRRSPELGLKLMLGDVKVDGVWAGSNIIYEKMHTYQLSGRRTSPTTIRPLVFSPLQLTDDDAHLNTMQSVDLGDIVMKLYRAEASPNTHAATSWPPISNTETKLHERSKKAVAHRVQFGAEKTTPATTIAPHPQLIEMLATFIFKYRSIDILRANGIAPSDEHKTSNKRKATEVDEVDDDSGQNIEVEEKVKALEAQILALKATRKHEGQSKVKRVKTEIKSESRPIFVSGEVIDLT